MLHLDLSSLKASSNGTVTGEIWFDEDFAFPEAGWSDFPIEVLTWWLELLAKLASGQLSSGQVSFMDGPYRVRAAVAGDMLRLDFLSEHLRVSGGSRVTSFANTVKHSIDITAALLDECRRRKWTSPEIDNLQLALKTVESQIRTGTS
jgi:hypothetical protein